MILLVACSKSPDDNSVENGQESITGDVIEDSQENCRLANESDCSPIVIRRGEPENENKGIVQETVNIANATNKSVNLSKEKIILSDCQVGWKCVDPKYRAYQFLNCSWVSIEYCVYGCGNGTCNPPPVCKTNSLKCDNDNVLKCTYGYGWELNESCNYQCLNGVCLSKNETLQINTTSSSNSTNSTNSSSTTQINNFISDNCMIVSRYNLTGSSATDEYFTLKNSCSYQIDMTGWTASDNVINHIYNIPAFNLAGSAEVTIVTGIGVNNQTTLYWGRSSAIWNNNGDTLYLNLSNGTSILIQNLTP